MARIPYPHHRLAIDAALGTLHLSADLELSAPWTVIFGPSGIGKSSVLRAACGLLPGADVTFKRCTSPDPELDTADLPRMVVALWTSLTDCPTHQRSIAYAPQGAILFPHLTVRRNISFATDSTHHPSPQLIAEILDLFELSPLADRKPSDLSGGERQRVNLARAFAVPEPKLFLLDEPFTGLDRNLRDILLPRMQQRALELHVPVLSVTHDVEETLLLNAQVIRLEHGAVTDQGPAAHVLAPEISAMLHILRP